jgi:hypothetical protein
MAAALMACFVARTLIETVDGLLAVEVRAVSEAVVAGWVGRAVRAGSWVSDCARHPRPNLPAAQCRPPVCRFSA